MKKSTLIIAALACTTGPAWSDAAPADPCAPGRYETDRYFPAPAFAGQTRAPLPAQRSAYRVEVLTKGLANPGSLAFLPDGRLLITERPGQLRLLARDGRLSAPIAGVPESSPRVGGGRIDVLLARDFERSRTLYFSYFAALPDGAGFPGTYAEWLALGPVKREQVPIGTGRIMRARLSDDGTRLLQVELVFEGRFFPRRMAWAPDGTLYVTLGPPVLHDLGVDDQPQFLDNYYGKVIRLNADGSIPKDNPFLGRSGALPALYSSGLRDVQGLALHPQSGALWTAENGPRGGDEINVQRAGGNYGFPVISYGREYSEALLNNGLTAKAGLLQPVYFWTPSIAPSGIAFYTGDLFPEWRGNLFVAGLAGKRLSRLVLEGERVIAEEPLLKERCRRIRAPYQGPDGALYVLTDEADGEVLRLTPQR